MKSRYDFQTDRIKEQHAEVMNAHAARQVRDVTIKISYQVGHISYDRYREKMVESRREMFRREKISCLNYQIAMMTFDAEMYTDHPETYVA